MEVVLIFDSFGEIDTITSNINIEDFSFFKKYLNSVDYFVGRAN